MLNRIIKYSLQNRLIVLVISVILLVVATLYTKDIDVDIFPDLNAPTVVVMTEAHGMAPEEVERMVTFPIETAVNGAANIRRVRSSSSMGFSLVWVEFDWGTDIYDARQTVSEKLISIASELPKEVDAPVIAPQTSLLGEILIFSMTADSTNAMDLRTIAEWTVRPRLLSVPGVAQTTMIGGELKEYLILAVPEKMKFFNVSFSELIEVCEGMNQNVTGGYLSEYGNSYIVRGISRSDNIKEIGNSVIKVIDEVPVKISDVADVKIGTAPKLGDGSYEAEKAIVITVSKQPDINTIDLTEKINEALDEIKTKLPPDVKIHNNNFEQATFIKTAIKNVRDAIIEGAIFVIIILILFLMNFRATVISVLAIPFSIMVSLIAMKLLGITINTMTLGGMAIAIGSLVDDAIIDVENVYKRLKENSRLSGKNKKSSIQVIYDASTEIRASIFNATLIIIIAFIPLFFLSGMEGRMLKPLGLSFIVALFASLIVALTLTPVLCSYLLTDEEKLARRKTGSFLSRWLTLQYSKLLDRVLKKKKTALITTIVILLAAASIFFTLGNTFLPPFNEGSLTINLNSVPGISLNESDKIGKQAEEILLSIPEVITTARKTGRAELAEHSFGTNVSEIDVPFKLTDRTRSEFLADLRSKLKTISGASVEVGQPISHRLDHMLSGSKTNIAIKLFGSDLGDMYHYATVIKSEIQNIEGIADLNVEQIVEVPQIKIRPKRDMLAKYGITIKDFSRFIEYAFSGEKVSDVFENDKSFDMVLRFNDESRNTVKAIRNAMIDTWSGSKVPLYYVADIKSESGPNKISRENVNRKIVVSANVSDRDIKSVLSDIKKKIKSKVTLPDNYRIEYGGQFESAENASRILLITSFLAIIVIFLILFQEFKNPKTAGIILINLPLALIGGVISIWIYSGVLSIPAIIGFITLFGIATRNGILLVSKYQNLMTEGHNLTDAIIKGSLDRLNPILMTALTAALALIPLALTGDKPGNEIQSPMAVVILGGLLSSTFLNIFVIPVVYSMTKPRAHLKEIKESI